jgi:hypothetical protein
MAGWITSVVVGRIQIETAKGFSTITQPNRHVFNNPIFQLLCHCFFIVGCDRLIVWPGVSKASSRYPVVEAVKTNTTNRANVLNLFVI